MAKKKSSDRRVQATKKFRALFRNDDKHPCEACDEPTDLRGWYFVQRGKRFTSVGDMRKEFHWWCSRHFRMHMMNLYPYECTHACRKRHQKTCDARVGADDMLVWLQMETTFVAVDRMAETSRMQTLAPKCPWCTKPLKLCDRLFKNRFNKPKQKKKRRKS